MRKRLHSRYAGSKTHSIEISGLKCFAVHHEHAVKAVEWCEQKECTSLLPKQVLMFIVMRKMIVVLAQFNPAASHEQFNGSEHSTCSTNKNNNNCDSSISLHTLQHASEKVPHPQSPFEVRTFRQVVLSLFLEEFERKKAKRVSSSPWHRHLIQRKQQTTRRRSFA